MKRSLIVFSDPENSCLKPISMREFKRILDDFGQGTKLTLSLENYKRTRSLPQNNLLHLYIGEIAKDTGEDSARIKEMLKMMFGVKEEMRDRDGHEVYNEQTGEAISVWKSTSEYTTDEMAEFIDNVQKWSSDFLGLILPDPEEMRNFKIKM